jgi:hypothetical protein
MAPVTLRGAASPAILAKSPDALICRADGPRTISNQLNGGVGDTFVFGFFQKSTQTLLRINAIHTVVLVDTFVQ